MSTETEPNSIKQDVEVPDDETFRDRIFEAGGKLATRSGVLIFQKRLRVTFTRYEGLIKADAPDYEQLDSGFGETRDMALTDFFQIIEREYPWLASVGDRCKEHTAVIVAQLGDLFLEDGDPGEPEVEGGEKRE